MAIELESILTQYPRHQRDKLLPILHEVQQAYGYLSEESISGIGRYLGLPTSKIYGVATFYDHFRFSSKGKFHLQLCSGTSCHISEKGKLLEAIEKSLLVKPGEVSRDNTFSLELAPCMGACGLGPVLAVNDEYHTQLTVDSFLKLAESLKSSSI